MKKMIIKFYNKLSEVKMVILGLFKIKIVVNEDSYYVDYNRKNVYLRYIDNIRWLIKYKEVNEWYNSYGLDILNFHESESFLSHYEFNMIRNSQMKISNKINKSDYSAMLTDKYVFNKYIKSVMGNEFTPKVIGLNYDGKIYHEDSKKVLILEDFLKDLNDKVIFKPINEASGRGVYLVEKKNNHLFINNKRKNIEDLQNIIINMSMIIEEVLENHHRILNLNPYSLSTVRIITIRDGSLGGSLTDQISVFAGYLRTSSKSNVPADNNGQGGISIGVNMDTGCLKKIGVFDKKFGTTCYSHPLTQKDFEDFLLPTWNEAIDLVKTAHKHFYGVKSIGWDVAITEDGPKLIEGNIDWNFPMAQMANGPLKNQFKEMFLSGGD